MTPTVAAPRVTQGGEPASRLNTLPCRLVKLGALMARGTGRPEVRIGLIDGPVALDHPDLRGKGIRALPGREAGCTIENGAACFHGTFVAGILGAARDSSAPALCPDCSLVARPIFGESAPDQLLVTSPEELAAAMLECIDAGARVLNLSVTLARATPRDERALQTVLDHACRRGVAVVAAAGNESAIGGSVITRHPWVIPVVGYSLAGRPLARSTLGARIGRHGLGAPGEGVTSLCATGGTTTARGTSVAAPFVTGTLALLLSEFPRASVSHVRAVLTGSRRRTVVPPLLDAEAAYRTLLAASGGRRCWR